jgi:hypothetical protein
MTKPFSFETFQMILENDNIFSIDETLFYFDDEPEDENMRFLGCIREYDKPYWVGYCDIPDGCDFFTASDLLNAKIFGGKSIKDRWEHVVIEQIGCIGLEDWLVFYADKL